MTKSVKSEIEKLVGKINRKRTSIYAGTHERLAFTAPTENCLYVRILRLLADGEVRTKNEIYTALGGEQREYRIGWETGKVQRKWVNWGVLTAMARARLVIRNKYEYQIGEKGRQYLSLISA